MAAAITEYINAYFKGGQHNRSAPRRSDPRGKSLTLKRVVVIPCVRFLLPPDVW